MSVKTKVSKAIYARDALAKVSIQVGLSNTLHLQLHIRTLRIRNETALINRTHTEYLNSEASLSGHLS